MPQPITAIIVGAGHRSLVYARYALDHPDRLKIIGAGLLSRTLTDLDAGTAPRVPQKEENATYVTRLDRSMSPIDWNRTPREIVKQIYGLQPWPCAVTELEGNSVKIFGAAYSDRHTERSPGTLVSTGKDGIEFACADGACLTITELQLPGKKRMSAADFLRGHPISV